MKIELDFDELVDVRRLVESNYGARENRLQVEGLDKKIWWLSALECTKKLFSKLRFKLN